MSGRIQYIERKGFTKLKLILTIWFVVSFGMVASSKHYYDTIYQCYINNQMDKWKQVIHEMEMSLLPHNSVQSLYDITFTIYGYVGYCIGIDDKKDAVKYIAKAESYIETMLKEKPVWPEVLALKSAFYGFKIGVAPLKAMYYGPKSFEYLNKAYDISANTWQVLLEKGNVEYYIPPVFGGSKKEAIRFYSQAIALMEKKQEHTGNWVYLSTLTMLAHAYELVGDIDKAFEVYKKTLKIEPDYLWVKNELLPDFKLKHQL